MFLCAIAGTLYYRRSTSTASSEPIRIVGDQKLEVELPTGKLGIITTEESTRYVDAILDPKSEEFPRLQCPNIPNPSRYDRFRAPASLAELSPTSPSAKRGGSKVKYFFAIDLREALPLLPRLLGSVVETIRFLGPSNCALSIVEGNSNDGTYDVLKALRPKLESLATTYYLQSSTINPQEGDRIGKLADLRNLAVQPLKDEPARYTADTTVIFLNDVAACSEDILELIHQRQVQEADMVCPLDWTYVGQDPTFYDVWIARGMTGDSFFEIPPDGNWNSAWNLFWNDDEAKSSLFSHVPFQVFACWNGATVFTAKPFVNKVISFRAPYEGECSQGEPQLFCKDMWFHGYGKIAVVPSISLEYSDEGAKKIKALKGFTSDWAKIDSADIKIQWRSKPPEKVKCMPSYDQQSFRPWDETL